MAKNGVEAAVFCQGDHPALKHLLLKSVVTRYLLLDLRALKKLTEM